jgi:hypothetical protein
MSKTRRDLPWPDFPRELGVTPRERLAWLLDRFAYLDLDRLSEREQASLRQGLRDLVIVTGPVAVERAEVYETLDGSQRFSWRDFGMPWMLKALGLKAWPRDWQRYLRAVPETLPTLKAAQAQARQVVETVAAAGNVYLDTAVEEGDPVPTEDDDKGGPVLMLRLQILRCSVSSMHSVEARTFDVDVSAPLPDAVAVTTLSLASRVAGLLRRCPYGGCSRVFVIRKAQKWCAEHRVVIRRAQMKKAYAKFKKEKKRRARRKGGSR